MEARLIARAFPFPFLIIMPINTAPHIHNLVVCANIFVRKGGKYILLKRSPHKKYVPNVVHPVGGKIEPNENPYLGAQRELLEETGITVTNMRLEAVVLSIKPIPGENENWLIFHFSADYASGELIVTEEGELVLLDKEEIPNQDLLPELRLIIHHILDPEDGTVFLTVAYDKEGKIIEETKNVSVCAL